MAAIDVTSVVRTCYACPSQWEGETADGRYVYARYRWGYLCVGVGDSWDQAIQAGSRPYMAIVSKQLGDNMDGVLGYDELKMATAGVIVWPEWESAEDDSD